MKGVVWLILDSGIQIDEYDPKKTSQPSAEDRRYNIYLDNPKPQTLNKFITEFTAARYKQKFPNIRTLRDELQIIDANIAEEQMIHEPQDVARKFKMTCGIRRCGEQGVHRYKEVAKKALKGIAGFEKIEPNLLIETWQSFPFVRNTKNKLTPLRLSMLVDLNKRSVSTRTRRPQQIVPNRFGPKTFYPTEHRQDAMNAKNLKDPFSSYNVDVGIQIGRDPDDNEELKVGTSVWIINTPFNVTGKHFTGLKSVVVASSIEKPTEPTKHQANLAGNIHYFHVKDCMINETTHLPFTRSDLYHKDSRRPVRLDSSMFDIKA